MIQSEIDYLDGEIQVQEEEPSTLQELIELIGEQAVVEETTSNLRYRNKYPRVYKKASAELAALTPRAVKETKTNKDGTQKNILVSEMDHLRECFKADAERTREVIDRHAKAEPLYVKGERTGGGGMVSAAALESANLWFSQGDEVVEGKIDIIEANVPGYKVGRDANGVATPESVARGIQALNKHLEAKAKRESAGLLGKV